MVRLHVQYVKVNHFKTPVGLRTVICTSMNFIGLNSDRSWKFLKSKIVRIRFPVYYNVMVSIWSLEYEFEN